MDLCGFKCAKNTLMILNVFYIIVGIILIAVGGHLITSNKLTSLPIIGGIVACGVFLMLISALGIYGAARHHQVMLFFYMIILFMVFFIQFVVACVCLGVSTEKEKKIVELGWKYSTTSVRSDVQQYYECCGYLDVNSTDKYIGHPSCENIDACSILKVNGTEKKCQPGNDCCTNNDNCSCPLCEEKIADVIEGAFYSAGVTSLLFAFTELSGIWLTMKFRNMGPYSRSSLKL